MNIIKYLYFNQCVLLDCNTFSFGPVMVHANLRITWTDNGGSFSESNFVILFELIELPPNEAIIIWVELSSDKRASPIDCYS